jgi:hypothetical protein
MKSRPQDEAPREAGLVEATVDLVHRLDRVVAFQEATLSRETERLALLRGMVNQTLFAGMAKIPTANQPIKLIDAVVPFAWIAFADPGGLTLSFSVEGAGATSGTGTLVANANDWASAPLIGRSLFVTANNGGLFYLAVFTRPQAFGWGKC